MKRQLIVAIALACASGASAIAQNPTLGDLVTFSGEIVTDAKAPLRVTGPTTDPAARPPVGTIVCQSANNPITEIVRSDGVVTLKLVQNETANPDKKVPGVFLIKTHQIEPGGTGPKRMFMHLTRGDLRRESGGEENDNRLVQPPDAENRTSGGVGALTG